MSKTKKYFDWQVILGISLVLLSALIYFFHFLIFRDAHHIFIYLIGDIAFVPVEVLLVTLIIHRLLSKREKAVMLKKLNMLIGAFYSDAGTDLLNFISSCDRNIGKIDKELIVSKDWAEEKFVEVSICLEKYDFKVDIKKIDLKELRDFLNGKRNYFMRLLENPNLLEHEKFTDLLWAVFHLTEELLHRKNFRNLPDTDYEHLEGDIRRVYIILVRQWLDYMKHLKDNYPYLFSLAMRTNPFNRNASAIVK
ncbi:hypothetical protein ACFLUV_01655 [Elusimicrobiota bacterium]